MKPAQRQDRSPRTGVHVTRKQSGLSPSAQRPHRVSQRLLFLPSLWGGVSKLHLSCDSGNFCCWWPRSSSAGDMSHGPPCPGSRPAPASPCLAPWPTLWVSLGSLSHSSPSSSPLGLPERQRHLVRGQTQWHGREKKTLAGKELTA